MEVDQINGFSLFEQTKPVNNDITVIYTPDSSIMKYEYRISKNGVYDDYIQINNSNPATIFLNDSGNYKIEVKFFDNNQNIQEISSGIYKIDKDKPIIELNETLINMEIGSTLNVMGGVKAYDNQDGNLLNKVTTNYNQLDFTTIGLKKLTYTVSDEAGNVTNASVNINVTKNYSDSIFIIQSGILAILFVFVFLIMRYRRSINLEKRISKYTISPLRDNSLSLFENVLNVYKKIITKFSKLLSKSSVITKYSKRYDKYINTVDTIYSSGMELVGSKFLISFTFLLIAIFAKTIQYELLTGYEILFPIVIGFFMLDFVYIYKYRLYRNVIENDLLQAIIIMNNAFKSGRSITQAIELVTKELEGPVAEEFKKMHLEITFGLSIEVVFKRFASRIKLEEVTYLTASLTILNKTGGDIIKVFSSIEKSLFNKKKLKLELQSLTGSSRLIVYVLIAIPILFIALVSLINPTYFVPFYSTPVGFVLSAIMIVIYIVYIIFVRKIMKVRM